MRLLAAAVALIALSGCNRSPEWTGWVYPNGADLTRSIKLGRFETADDCRTAARSVLANINLRDEVGIQVQGDYECGRSCKVSNRPELNVCAETVR